MPDQLYLSIMLEYLPRDRGTLMVDMGVQDLDERGQAVGDEKPLQFCVHYVNVGPRLRYCVRLAEVGVQVPAEMNLKEWADHQDWARMDTGIPASGRSSEKEYFAVHLGAWHQSLRSRRAKKRREQFEMVNAAAEALGLADDAWEVPPQTVLPAGSIMPVLESGRFEVDGAVFFDPLSPFQSDPQIPSAETSTDDQLIAREPITFNYS